MTTYASLLTGTTRGAVATIAVLGQNAQAILNAGFSTAGPAPIRADQVRYGMWHGGKRDESTGESVVVSRNADLGDKLPMEQSWEVHCHGGLAAANRILDDLTRLGAEVISQLAWFEINFEALLASTSIDRLGSTTSSLPSRSVTEAWEVLVRTPSQRTAGIVLDQARGAMHRFVVDAIHELTQSNLLGTPLDSSPAEHATSILKFSDLGLHLVEPWRVVLAGPPNVGKSSLINALLGYKRSITVDEPGTTRDVLEAHTVIDGWLVRLSDTAGIREDAECGIEAAGIESALAELADADLVLWVQDATADVQEMDWAFLKQRCHRVIEVANKCDQLRSDRDWEPNEPTTSVDQRRIRMMTSATTGIGIDELRSQITKVLIPELPEKDCPVPITQRQVDLLRAIASTIDISSWLGYLSELESGSPQGHGENDLANR